MSGKLTLRIPLQQYGYLEVEGDTAEEVRTLAESAYHTRLFQTGIEIEQVAVAQAAVPGARVVETHSVGEVPAPVASPTPPAPAPVSPAGAGPAGKTCKHGDRVYRTGTSAKGDWTAWFCPQPKGSDDICKPIWK